MFMTNASQYTESIMAAEPSPLESTLIKREVKRCRKKSDEREAGGFGEVGRIQREDGGFGEGLVTHGIPYTVLSRQLQGLVPHGIPYTVLSRQLQGLVPHGIPYTVLSRQLQGLVPHGIPYTVLSRQLQGLVPHGIPYTVLSRQLQGLVPHGIPYTVLSRQLQGLVPHGIPYTVLSRQLQGLVPHGIPYTVLSRQLQGLVPHGIPYTVLSRQLQGLVPHGIPYTVLSRQLQGLVPHGIPYTVLSRQLQGLVPHGIPYTVLSRQLQGLVPHGIPYTVLSRQLQGLESEPKGTVDHVVLTGQSELVCLHRSRHVQLLKDPSLPQTVPVRLDAVTYLAVKKALAVSRLQHGGHYCPADCRPRDRTAILIPYRDRRQQLMKLLFNLVPFLIRQRVCFTIFVIEQTSEFPFNRCLLFNVGFVESQKVANFTCFIVHDTDLVPRRYGNLYHCHDNRPRHFVIKRSNKPFRGLPYKTYIGGALAVRRNHMEKINGCSNLYYNWGFEDDDLYERFRMTNQTPVRYQDVTLGEYVALEHALQPRNKHKRELLSTARERMSQDGLSTLSYTLEDFLERELFTWMLVAIPPPPASLYAPSRKTPNTRH
ncbi:hypothetical protein ACOMHN_056909 [Nucella lapillus]